jgi:hypothetical protein
MLKHTFIYVFLFLPSILFASNTFLVAPTSAEIDLTRPNTVSFIVTNNGDGQARIAISPIYFPVDSKFMPTAKPLHPDTTKKDDLSPYMVISPKTVSLKSGEQRTVRVSIRPPATGFTDGEYRAHVLFAMLDIADSVKSKAAKSGVSMKINFKSETAVVVYGNVGKGLADLSTTCELLKNEKIKVNITNSGKWRFDGWLSIVDGDKKLTEDKIFMIRESMRDSVLNWAPKDTNAPIKITWKPLDDKKKPFTTLCAFTVGK